MNGGIRNHAMQTLFARPMKLPSKTMITMATGVANTELASGPPSDVMRAEPATLVTAMIDVTDKSIPAAINTIVCPAATTRSGNMAKRTLLAFSTDAKPGANGVINRHFF